MAKNLLSLCLVAFIVPYAYSLGIEVNLGLNLPNLALGLDVSSLISIELAASIIASPPPNNTMYDCETSSAPPIGRNVLTSTSSRWYPANDGTGTWFMPVVIDTRYTSTERNVILAGMTDIQNKSCMRFKVYTEANIQGSDYVFIQRGVSQGCYSDRLGRGGVGKQIVNIQPSDGVGTCVVSGIVSHELLHAIGFAHQQNAPGRDSKVTIQWGNIQSGYSSQFQEVSSTTFSEYGYPYDYGSVMHYGAYAFSSNGQKTIVTLNGASIGQRQAISSYDGNKLNKKYGCPTQ